MLPPGGAIVALDSDPTIEKLQRIVYHEFLLEPDLFVESGIEDLPAKLATRLGCAEQRAVEKLVSSPYCEPLSLAELKELLTIRDMSLVSKTAAAVSAELKDPAISYDSCCRTALCYAIIGSPSHVFSSLRAAAAKNDRWARHHYLYSLVLGLEGNFDRARWEAGMALQYEPYEEGRGRICLASDLLNGIT
jgi:hypothetical protein